MLVESRAELPETGRFGGPLVQRTGPPAPPTGPCPAGRFSLCRLWFDADFGPNRQRSRRVHRFPSEKAPRGAGGGSDEYSDPGKRLRRDGKALGDLCARCDPCRFGPACVSNLHRRGSAFAEAGRAQRSDPAYVGDGSGWREAGSWRVLTENRGHLAAALPSEIHAVSLIGGVADARDAPMPKGRRSAVLQGGFPSKPAKARGLSVNPGLS